MRRVARCVSVAWILAGAAAARADDLTGTIAPGVSNTRTVRTDAAGRTSTQELTDLSQQYRLSLDHKLYPTLGFSGSGLFAKDLVWSRDANGTARTDETAATLSTRLTLGGGTLGGALSYDRRQEAVTAPGGRGWAIGNTYGAAAGWRPAGLPSLDLRLTRQDVGDPSSPDSDAVAYDGIAALAYQPTPELDLRYTLRVDEVSRPLVDTSTVGQEARATWHGSLGGGRTSAYATVGVASLWSDTRSADPAGTVPTQRFPVAGLSLVEDFPAVPETDTLAANPALVNGDLRTPAALDLGPSVGAADRRPRDLGVQLADAITKVSRVDVWVDRALPAAVSGAFQWEVYRSDDGQHWARVPLAGAVTFGVIENRFQLPIAETAARWLKVVTRAIDPSVTTDPRWASIWVTELQIYDVVPAATLQRSATRMTETFSGSAQTRLLSSPALTHDVSASVTHPTDGSPTTWLVVNGLSVVHRAAPTLTLSGRVANQESDAGTGQAHALLWTATAAHQPLPTISEGLTYTGQLTRTQGRLELSNAVAGYGRAQIYKGVAATANASYALTSSGSGPGSRAATASSGLSLVPNRLLSFAATYGVTSTRATTPGQPDSTTTRHRVDTTASFTPVQAVYLSAGVTRLYGDEAPSTLAHVSVNLSPFADGQIVARFTYSDTIDTAATSRTQLLTPTLRWTVRPGLYLDLAYTDIRTRSSVDSTRLRTAAANLVIPL